MLDTQKVKALREGMGLTMEAAARAAKLSSRQAWHRIESGKNADIAVSTLADIATALGVAPCDLLLDGTVATRPAPGRPAAKGKAPPKGRGKRDG